MRSKLIATASAFVLLAGTAMAQTAPPSATNRTPAPGNSMSTTATPAARTPAPDPMKMEDVSKITGSTVYGTDDSKIGSISTVLMNPENKTVDRFVVSEGGVLGVGGHKVALPVDQFTWDSEKGGFKVAKSTDDLKSMPEWKNQSASTQ
jgi:sporulation protein YlmC with PRC-barrel domain